MNSMRSPNESHELVTSLIYGLAIKQIAHKVTQNFDSELVIRELGWVGI